jgi:hypothetical protein
MHQLVVTCKRPYWQTLNIYKVNGRSQLTADLIGAKLEAD